VIVYDTRYLFWLPGAPVNEMADAALRFQGVCEEDLDNVLND